MKTNLMVLVLIAVMPITYLLACNSNKNISTGQPNEKVFYLAGLKYETHIKLNIEANGKVSGTVTSNKHGLDGETTSFVGTLKTEK